GRERTLPDHVARLDAALSESPAAQTAARRYPDRSAANRHRNREEPHYQPSGASIHRVRSRGCKVAAKGVMTPSVGKSAIGHLVRVEGRYVEYFGVSTAVDLPQITDPFRFLPAISASGDGQAHGTHECASFRGLFGASAQQRMGSLQQT